MYTLRQLSAEEAWKAVRSATWDAICLLNLPDRLLAARDSENETILRYELELAIRRTRSIHPLRHLTVDEAVTSVRSDVYRDTEGTYCNAHRAAEMIGRSAVRHVVSSLTSTTLIKEEEGRIAVVGGKLLADLSGDLLTTKLVYLSQLAAQAREAVEYEHVQVRLQLPPEPTPPPVVPDQLPGAVQITLSEAPASVPASENQDQCLLKVKPLEQDNCVNTKAGVEVPPLPQPPLVPKWDRLAQTLSFGGTPIRVFAKRPAPRQFEVLNAFEAAGWTSSVRLEGFVVRQLRDTVDELNKGLVNTVIVFRSVTSCLSVQWQVVG